MKIKPGYLMKKVGDDYVVVSVDSKVVNFNSMISLNESGCLLWKKLEEGCSEEDLVKVILNEYDIEEAIAKQDVEEFLANLRKHQLIDWWNATFV